MEISMYKVVLINFNFTYDQLDRYNAFNRAEEMGYEANVYDGDNNHIAFYSPISGWKIY